MPGQIFRAEIVAIVHFPEENQFELAQSKLNPLLFIKKKALFRSRKLFRLSNRGRTGISPTFGIIGNCRQGFGIAQLLRCNCPGDYPCGTTTHVSPSEKNTNGILIMAIKELDLLQLNENPWPLQFRYRIAGDSRLISNGGKCSEGDIPSPSRENRQKQSCGVLPEPIVPVLRISTGATALYDWAWLGWRSGDRRFSSWQWHFLGLALLIFEFFVLAIPNGW